MGSRKAQDMVMKYRIKVVELPDGSKEYFPQYKVLFFWLNFENKYEPLFFKNIVDCRKFIDYQIKLQKKQNVRFIDIDNDSK